MNKRTENERKFKKWEDREDGSRIYSYTVFGKNNWYAKYVKIVDRDENTLTFRQEIYDSSGKLVEIHEKYPVDKGHRKVNNT